MPKSHGSGQVCQKLRVRPMCEECRTYNRESKKARYDRGEGYDYRRSHALGPEGTKRSDYMRRYQRAGVETADRAALQILEDSWRS